MANFHPFPGARGEGVKARGSRMSLQSNHIPLHLSNRVANFYCHPPNYEKRQFLSLIVCNDGVAGLRVSVRKAIKVEFSKVVPFLIGEISRVVIRLSFWRSIYRAKCLYLLDFRDKMSPTFGSKQINDCSYITLTESFYWAGMLGCG